MNALPAPPRFSLGAGFACLDFANTVGDRDTEAPRERLPTYAELVRWGREAGVVDRAAAAELEERARREPAEAAAALARAVALREAVFGVFAAAAAGRRPADEDLDRLNDELSRALGRLRVAPAEDGCNCHWRWEEASDDLDRVLWPVARTAAELLTSSQLAAVRECASATCRWLFLDRSRNRSRRWCDMAVCGNRSKARRHYRRRKAAGG